MIKLNLGSGSIKLPDYTNVDFFVKGVDLEHDLRTPLPFPDNSVDEIRASHLVEHFSRLEWEKVRKDWARVIKPNGIIEIYCPDMDIVCDFFINNEEDIKWDWWIKVIYGWQGNEDTGDIEGQFHKNGFTFDKLAADFPDFDAVQLEGTTDHELHVKLTKRA